MDVSNDISSSPTSSSFHRRATHEEDEDLRKQMTGIFRLIDKNNTGYISIAQLEETIRELVSEGHNADFMEFIQSFVAYMETINALGKDSVDVNKMDLDAFCKCTKNYMMWRRVRQLKRQDSTSFYLNQSQELPRPNGRFRVSGPLMRVLQSKNLFSGITKQYTSYGDYHGTIGVAEFISAIPNTPERELRMLIGQLDVDQFELMEQIYYSLDEFFEDVGGLEHVMIGDVTSPNISQIDNNNNTPATPNGADSRPSASAMVRSMSKDLQKSNMELERKCDAFQTEIQFLTVSVSKLENELQKKDKEIERLKRDSKLVGVMQESEKEFQSQVSTLSSQVNKSNTVVEDLRRQFSEERDKAKMLAESLASKEEEVRKLTFTIKFQSTLQDKIAALQQYIHEVEQELEKERDKVMFYKNSALASPRPMERRNSEDRIPLFVRQSSFSASTPPLSVELLTHTMSHPITPAYPMTKLNFTSPSPITSPTHSVNLTPITSVSSSFVSSSVSSTPAGATPYAISTPSVPVTSSTPNVLSPPSSIAASSTIVSSSSLSSEQTHPLQSTPPASRSKHNSPIASRHDVPPIPINLSSPPSSPSVKPRSGSKGNLPPIQIPSSNNTTTTTTTTNTQSEPIPPPPATPQTALTQAPTVPNKTSSSISAANAHYARIPPAPLSPQLPSVSVTEPSPSSVSPPISHNVFLPSEPPANSGEDPALTSLRIQLWQLSTQLANTERLLAESQSRLESVLAAPRIPDSAWNVLKYFCPTVASGLWSIESI